MAVTRKNLKIDFLVWIRLRLFYLNVVEVVELHSWLVFDKHIDSIFRIFVHFLDDDFLKYVFCSLPIAYDVLNFLPHILVVVQLIILLPGLHNCQVQLCLL